MHLNEINVNEPAESSLNALLGRLAGYEGFELVPAPLIIPIGIAFLKALLLLQLCSHNNKSQFTSFQLLQI